jgi:hypothetical protein
MLLEDGQNHLAMAETNDLIVRNEEMLLKLQRRLTHQMNLKIRLETHRFRNVKIHQGRAEVLRNLFPLKLTLRTPKGMLLEDGQNHQARAEAKELIVPQDEIRTTPQRNLAHQMNLKIRLETHQFRNVKVHQGKVEIHRNLEPRKMTQRNSKGMLLEDGQNHQARAEAEELIVPRDEIKATLR